MKRLILVILWLLIPSWAAYSLPNGVDYAIEARLDIQQNIIYGYEQVIFTNRTGGPLVEIYFYVYPNAFKRGSESQYIKDLRSKAGISPERIYANPNDDAFMEIKEIKANGERLAFEINDTLMRVILAKELLDEEQIKLEIEFIYNLMEAPAAARMAARLAIRSGHRRGVYTISNWYPKVVVYDDEGWNLDQYSYIGEFYGDFGKYVVKITLPAEMKVGATGILVAEEQETEEQTKTLTFVAEGVHDFAWVASTKYTIEKQEWNGIIVNSLYLDEAHLGPIALEALKYYSEQFGKYAYQEFTIAEVEVGGGMEYPGIVMIGGGSEVEIVHEVGHQWWYGAVGNDEFDEAWLDEGFTVFSHESYLIAQGDDPKQVRSSAYFREPGVVILQPASSFPNLNLYFEAVYTKGSGVLWMLRGLLGKEVFAKVMRAYYERYKYKNATVSDFIAVSEELSGQELDWFFEQWLRTTKQLDFSISQVRSERLSDGSFLHYFTVKRSGEAIMPVRLAVTLKNGRTMEERWEGQETAKEFALKAEADLLRIIIDPDWEILEENRANNQWWSGTETLLSNLTMAAYFK